MKLLQNPIAVGCLALVGVGMILKNSGALDAVLVKKRSSKPPVATVVSEPVPDSAMAGMATAALGAEEVMQRQIDFLRERLRTMEGGDVGPFNLPEPPESAIEEAARKLIAKDSLRLKATFLQEGRQLAVINNEVLGVGESISGFTLTEIESGRVHLVGPSGPDSIRMWAR